MMRFAARFFSSVFHPLLMPAYGVSVMFLSVRAHFVYTLPPEAKWAVAAILFFNTFILPAGFILYMWRTGRISDIQISDRRERLLPLTVALVFYASTYFVFSNLGLNRVYLVMMLAAVIGLTAAFLINFFWKISMHMIGLGGMTGVFYGLAYIYGLNLHIVISAGIIITGFTAASRMYLEQHTPAQIAAGFLLSFVLSAGTVFLGLR